MDPLRESVYYNQDGIVALGFGEFTNQVCGDYLPSSVGDSIGCEGTDGASREGFGPVASLATLNICGNVSGDARPPVVML